MITEKEEFTSNIYKALNEIQTENDLKIPFKSLTAEQLAGKLMKMNYHQTHENPLKALPRTQPIC
jgi:hypothetical protein